MSMKLGNGHTGTPAPKRDVELASTGSGPVVTYKLSDEELERYRSMPVEGGKQAKRLNLDLKRRSDGVGTFALSRDEYIAQRMAGKTRADIAKEQGVTAAGLVYHLSKWGMRTESDEKHIITEITVSGTEVSATNEPQSSVTVDEPKSEPVKFITVRVPLEYTKFPESSEWY